METIQYLFQYVVHIDEYLISFVYHYGAWTYVALFLIVFSETGLVITPFLPGDSLLFTAGSIAATHLKTGEDPVLSIQLLFVLLSIAAILGNKLNYLIGRGLGSRIFVSESTWWLNKKHLDTAHDFYERHGGKTIIMARFLPIIRTFAPFVAGASTMSVKKFTFYNILSGLLWVSSLLFAGYYLGRLNFIQEHFSLVIYGVIGFTLLPAIWLFLIKKIKIPST